MSCFHHSCLSVVLLCAACGQARADYLEDTGFYALRAMTGAAMPTGAGVSVTQVEAAGGGTTYMPQAGSGSFTGAGVYFSGKSFTAKAGVATASGHAFDVAAHFYGRNTVPSAGRSTMSPDVTIVDGWKADSYDDDFLAPGGGAPLVEARMIQNHSWIYYSQSADAVTINKLVRHMDYAIHRDGFLCCAGVNNGSGTVTPDLLAAGYNNISVGMTSGNHSRGGTSVRCDGPGRLKPEIVAPLDFTSFATPLVGSAAVLLRQTAEGLAGAANARRPQVLKACLLAGATREEFPDWSKSAAVPLDAVYGAGELNVRNSYAILTGLEQSPGGTAELPQEAWDLVSLDGGGTADYLLKIEPGSYGVELAASLVWHRVLTDPPGGGFNLQHNVPADCNLKLERLPAGGGAAVTVDSSESTIYNLEYVRALTLPAGLYRLHVSRAAGPGAAVDVALAWRLRTVPHQAQPEMVLHDATVDLSYTGLISGGAYVLQSSTDLQTWTDVEPVVAAGVTVSRSFVRPVVRSFYRLLPVSL